MVFNSVWWISSGMSYFRFFPYPLRLSPVNTRIIRLKNDAHIFSRPVVPQLQSVAVPLFMLKMLENAHLGEHILSFTLAQNTTATSLIFQGTQNVKRLMIGVLNLVILESTHHNVDRFSNN